MGTNTSWALAGNSVYAGCQWAVFILLVKSLPLADVGLFAYWIAVTGPLFVLANVRLRNLLATGVPSPGGFHDYLSARLLTTACAVSMSLAIAIAGSVSFQSLVVVALIAGAKGCDAVSDICHGLFQRELDLRQAAIGLMINGLVSVTLVVVSLVFWSSLVAATAAYAAGSSIALVAWDLPRSAALSERRNGGRTIVGVVTAIRRLISIAFPLGLSSAIGSVQLNVPRYVVAAYLGPTSLAVFAALAYIPTVGNLIVNATAQAALPVLARDVQISAARYRDRILMLAACGLALGVASVLGTALVGRSLLAWAYSAEYADHLGVLLWLMAAAGVTYSFLFLGTATTARRRFGAQLLISTTALLVVVCSAGPLVARHGLVGAAACLMAGAVVEACGYVIVTVHDLRFGAPLPGVGPGPLVEGAVLNSHG